MSIKITAPVEGFTGTVCGVAFADGAAEVDDLEPSVGHYFRRHGYKVAGKAPRRRSGGKGKTGASGGQPSDSEGDGDGSQDAGDGGGGDG